MLEYICRNKTRNFKIANRRIEVWQDLFVSISFVSSNIALSMIFVPAIKGRIIMFWFFLNIKTTIYLDPTKYKI